MARIKDELLRLKETAKALEPNEEKRLEIRNQVIQYAEEFLNGIDSIPAYVAPTDQLNKLVEDDLEHLAPMSSILDLLKDTVDHVGVNPASGGHLGYIPGGGIYTAALGDYLASVFNRFAGLYFGSPGAVALENKLIRWVCELMNYPTTALGNITSGGSIANLIALVTARDYKNIEGPTIKQSVIYYSSQTHHCVNKAAKIAGLGSCVYREIDLDSRFRLSPDHLAQQIQSDLDEGLNPFFLAASCGSTDTGAVDQFSRLSDICQEHQMWFHIDAAYGGFFKLLPEFADLFDGAHLADSIVLDPHKSLFLPYGSGLVIVKNGKALHQSFHYMANYLQDAYDGTEDISPADLSPELTKHFRGLRMWIPLKLHGTDAFRACLEEKHKLTLYFHREVQKLGFEVGPLPQLSVCIYRYVDTDQDLNTTNETLWRRIVSDQRLFVSTTTIDGDFWLRLAVLSFRTHIEHIDLLLKLLSEKTRSI